jgi:hypothetical protein
MAKHIDLLDEDKPIAEQKFVCLSFVSPEKIIKQKEMFMFENFVKQYNFNKSAQLLTQYSNFVAYKYGLNSDEVMEDMKEFAKSETEKMHESVEDDFKNFMDSNERELEETFSKEHEFQTSVRGIKVRGVFPSQQEAELRCKMLREVDPNHDVYVGPVGLWVPFHPEAYKTGRVEYLEKELNDLMHEKEKNESKAKEEFDHRVKKSKLEAMQKNQEMAAEHGNKLTQTINEKGDLVSIENMNSLEKNLGVNATIEDIQKELFEGDNIVTEKNSDHGLSSITKADDKPKEE